MGDAFKLKLKLPRAMAEAADNEASAARLIGARGGAALKEILSTAPNPEVAIRDFQATHGVALSRKKRQQPQQPSVNPALQLLDLLAVQRSSTYNALLGKLRQELLLRIETFSQDQLQRMLEATFPYIEFRELRAIPIAILSRQQDTPEMYLRELTENRRIMLELPVHVRRKIMLVEPAELHLFVEQCTQEYIEEQIEWYAHSASTQQPHQRAQDNGSSTGGSGGSATGTSSADHNDLWNVSSHVPTGSSSSVAGRPGPEERRRNNAALAKLCEMLGDSESLYLSTIEIMKDYVVAANIPGNTSANPKDYVDYVPFLGAMRADLANLQRDKTTSLLRTDPLHKFIWFLDRAMKNQTLEMNQLHGLLDFIAKLRTGDLPLNKKLKKKPTAEEEEENFEIVLGPPPMSELIDLLDKIGKSDTHLIFAEPVPDDVPKYRDVIKEPMDLSTMRKRVKRGKYKTLEQFTEDFNLMIRNCMTFNPSTTIFYKEGKRIGKRGNELIQKNAATLRGEPQRIRAKKRRKTGTNDSLSMLTSTGVVSVKDFGDPDQSGMVAEGMCEELLADVAMVVSDPHVKNLLCQALMKNLVLCWQKQELPTDNLVCRGLVQLLQVGNPSGVRRMLRKQDYVLRAPQVVTMRVVLPLLLRTMMGFRLVFAFPPSLQRLGQGKEDILDRALWENVLRASAAIRAMAKALIVQCVTDHQIDAGAQLLQNLLAADEDSLLRDRVFFYSITDVMLDQMKAIINASSSSTDPADAYERLSNSSLWKSLMEEFFLTTLESRTMAFKDQQGGVVSYSNATDENGDATKQQQSATVHAFAVPILHETTAMLLVSVLNMVDKADSSFNGQHISKLVTRTLGVLRNCCVSLKEFEALWTSDTFRSCRTYYNTLLSKCDPNVREIFFTVTEEEEMESKLSAIESEPAVNGNGVHEQVEQQVKSEPELKQDDDDSTTTTTATTATDVSTELIEDQASSVKQEEASSKEDEDEPMKQEDEEAQAAAAVANESVEIKDPALEDSKPVKQQQQQQQDEDPVESATTEAS